MDFINDLSLVLSKIDCKIISISIDLEEYIKRNMSYDIYEFSFNLLIRKFNKITASNDKLLIMLESRGNKEDTILLRNIVKVDYINKCIIFGKIQGIYFSPKWNKEYSLTYFGLEITDLFSYPIHQFIKYNKTNPAFEILKYKIYNYPKYLNNGIIIYPNK